MADSLQQTMYDLWWLRGFWTGASSVVAAVAMILAVRWLIRAYSK